MAEPIDSFIAWGTADRERGARWWAEGRLRGESHPATSVIETARLIHLGRSCVGEVRRTLCAPDTSVEVVLDILRTIRSTRDRRLVDAARGLESHVEASVRALFCSVVAASTPSKAGLDRLAVLARDPVAMVRASAAQALLGHAVAPSFRAATAAVLVPLAADVHEDEDVRVMAVQTLARIPTRAVEGALLRVADGADGAFQERIERMLEIRLFQARVRRALAELEGTREDPP
jgi:hypothetical protein